MGTSVRFRLADVYCPELGRVLAQIGPDVTVCGEVAFYSDRGDRAEQFAIVSVDGMETPLIVPVEKLLPLTGPLPGQRTQSGGEAALRRSPRVAR